MSKSPQRLDGNVTGGPLAAVLAFEVTTARCTCATCGATALFAELHVYADAPGMVVRCPSCEAVVLRLAETPGHTWADLRGARAFDVATGE